MCSISEKNMETDPCMENPRTGIYTIDTASYTLSKVLFSIALAAGPADIKPFIGKSILHL